MELTDIQDYAIQARVAAMIGAGTFDRVFAGVRFAEIDGPLLYTYAKDEQSAAAIEDDFSLLIADAKKPFWVGKPPTSALIGGTRATRMVDRNRGRRGTRQIVPCIRRPAAGAERS